jgi:hypothetical protein
MVKDKVTKEDLMKFNVGDQKVFTLPSFGKARSAQSYANQQKKATIGTNNPREFKAIIGDPIPETGQCSVTITRIA